MNALLGVLFLRGWTLHLMVGMSLLYAANMYFQSFGALSVVKINSAWFHVRERGVFGGIFGSIIASGYLLAITLGGFIYGRSKAAWGLSSLVLAPVFLVPAGAILVMFVVEFCTGFVRQGLLLYFIEFLDVVHGVKVGSAIQTWAGLGVTLGGICGGILCGWMSDRLFQSRRPPVAFIFYLGQIVSLLL